MLLACRRKIWCYIVLGLQQILSVMRTFVKNADLFMLPGVLTQFLGIHEFHLKDVYFFIWIIENVILRASKMAPWINALASQA